MLRVNSNNDLVVPPFECAWLCDEKLQLQDEAGCIDFEVKGETDATIIFKATPGSRRWQHLARAGNGDAEHEQNTTVILGSHRNSSLKIERDGQPCHIVSCPSELQLSSAKFQRFWISYHRGSISVGRGTPGTPPLVEWEDPSPCSGMRHIGLAAWDKFLAYRNLQMHPSVPRPLPPLSVCTEQDPPLPNVDGKHSAVTDEFPCCRNKLCTSSGCLGAQETEGENSPQICTLQDLCVEKILSNPDLESVCMGLLLAHQLEPALDSMISPLLSCLAARIETFVTQHEALFYTLPLPVLLQLLKNPCLEWTELQLFRAVVSWVQNAPLQDKEACLTLLLPLIRFPLMSSDDLHAVLISPFGNMPLLRGLVEEADEPCSGSGRTDSQALAVEHMRQVRGAKTGADPLAAARWQRRHSPAATELLFLHSGDANGVCHHLGTDYKRGPFVNPVLAGRLQVSASSPSCRLTDPKGVVSGKLLRANAAGPRRCDGCTFWQADLGPRHRLMCNYYTMRHDTSPNYPRSWALQASDNGKDWVDLRRHMDDAAINMAGQYESWPVAGHAACRPFRIFRLLLLGPTACPAPGPGSRMLPLSHMEFYGYFYHVTA